jgi:hypothetical protein
MKTQEKFEPDASQKYIIVPKPSQAKPTKMQNATDMIVNTVTNMNALKDLIKSEGNEVLTTYAKDIDKVNLILSRLNMNIAIYLKDHPAPNPAPTTAPSLSASVPTPAPTPVAALAPTPATADPAPEYFHVNDDNVHLLNRRCKIIIDVIKRMLVSPTTEKDVKTFMKTQTDLYDAFMTQDNGEPYKCSFYSAFRGHMELIHLKKAVI